MKKFFQRIFKSSMIGLFAVLLAAAGIDALDHYDNYQESVIGRIIFGENKELCAGDMVFISSENGGFCLDKYEASAGPECPIKNPANQPETRLNIENDDCYPVSVSGALPWTNISQTQAQLACAKAGKRLASSNEWYLAALGTPDKNDDWGKNDCQTVGNWESQPGLTGSGSRCKSASLAYDMIGNVWEWVAGEIRDGYLEDIKFPEQGYIGAVDSKGLPSETDRRFPDPNFNNDYLWIKEKGVRGIARGGYWDNGSEAGQFSMYLVSSPSFAGIGVGFRCVK